MATLEGYSQYLAINTGFPNANDRANGRTGAFLMIHGGCSSAGCYAMTDEQIAEIYALARESFFGGQTSFQLSDSFSRPFNWAFRMRFSAARYSMRARSSWSTVPVT
jgi:murein L,D-transpeptidase YafK